MAALLLKPQGVPDGTVPNGHKARIVAVYDYRDAGGELLYQVVRYAPKAFRQRRPDGNGNWSWHVKGR